MTRYDPYVEARTRWPRILDHPGQLPDRSLAILTRALHDLDQDDLDDPVSASHHLAHLYDRGVTPAGLRAYSWAYIGGAAAALFQPSRVYFGYVPAWTFRAAVLLAGMAEPQYPPCFPPEVLAAITSWSLSDSGRAA